MKNPRTLISGAGIAGPTLAYWLDKHGFTPTIVETALQLRTGGFAVDVRGPGADVAKKMGLWPQVQALSTDLRTSAYLLAGELKQAQGEHERAFAAYQAALRPLVDAMQKQIGHTGALMVPRTRLYLLVPEAGTNRLIKAAIGTSLNFGAFIPREGATFEPGTYAPLAMAAGLVLLYVT